MNLNWKRCRGQCFEGTSNMSGAKKSVATQIAADEPRALFLHCYGHSLNLAMCETIKQCQATCNAVDVTHEIGKLVRFSPTQNAKFDELKEVLAPDTPGFCVLWPTRWTVWAKSLHSIEDNYEVLQQL